MTTTVKQMVDMVFEIAKEIVRDGDPGPCFFVSVPQTPIIMIPATFTSPAQKEAIFSTMRRFLHEVGAEAYCFATEAWMRQLQDGNRGKHGALDGLAPSEAPDRFEVLLIDAWDKNGAHEVMCLPIVTADGVRTLGDPDPTVPKAEMHGRAANLLFPEPVGGMQ